MAVAASGHREVSSVKARSPVIDECVKNIHHNRAAGPSRLRHDPGFTTNRGEPVKRLYLNLVEDPEDEELGLKYDLRFLTDKGAAAEDFAEDKWFRVGAVLDLANSGPAIMKELERRRIANTGDAFQRLYDLYEAVRILKPMNYFLVTDQDPDKVLEIFVRVNSGGTTLSYSDLLLSMATNQWKELDAREEVRSLVSD